MTTGDKEKSEPELGDFETDVVNADFSLDPLPETAPITAAPAVSTAPATGVAVGSATAAEPVAKQRVGILQVLRMIVVAAFFGALAMFVFQNLEPVQVDFAAWSLELPLAALIGGVGVLGNVIGSLLMFGRRRKKAH